MAKRIPQKDSIKQILVITVSNVGDVILTTPAISRLRENFPASRITVLVGPKAYPLLKGSATVDDVLPYDKHSLIMSKLKLVRSLRKRRFGLVVDFRQSLIPLFLGARYRTPVLRCLRRSRHDSMRKKHLQLIETWKLSASPGNGFEFFKTEDKELIVQRLVREGISHSRPLVVVAPGARSELKRWTIEGFREACEALVQERGVNIILVGEETEKPVCDELTHWCSKRLVNWCGKTSLRQLAALISDSALVVANDSAVMHLANELDIPCVAIFGPTSEKKYGGSGKKSVVVRRSLPCAPCERAQCKAGSRSCLDELSPQEVTEAAFKLLDRAY